MISTKKENNSINGLPDGWYWAKINDLIGPNGVYVDGDWVESKDQNPNGEIRLIQLADIGDGFFRDRSDRFMDHTRAVELNCTFLEKDDVLIARMPDPLGRSCLFPFSEKIKYVTVVDVAIIRPGHEQVLPKLVMFFINSPRFRNNINELQSGTTRKRISRGNLSTLDFPLPPLSEQHRIVSKLERLFARLARAEAALAEAETTLERYRQSVLNTAFKAEDEDGNLKEGWKWVTVKDVGEVVTGTTPSTQERKYYGDDYPFYKPTDLEQGFYTEDARDHLSELGAKVARMLPPKSILVTCIGATIGKTGFSRKAGSTNQQINAIIPNRGLVPEFGYFFVISDFFQKQIKENASSTTLPILNKSKFERLPFVLPPSDVQNQIVLQIETAINRASSLHETINQIQTECTQLRQSILQEAFGGRLVPQVASDEPASVLIERIKSARNQQEKSNKQRGKSPSKNIEKKMAKVKEGQPILDILRASDGVPVKAQTVWLQSEFKDSIDKFYEALKVLIEVEKTVKETREGDITYLILNDEN